MVAIGLFVFLLFVDILLVCFPFLLVCRRGVNRLAFHELWNFGLFIVIIIKMVSVFLFLLGRLVPSSFRMQVLTTSSNITIIKKEKEKK